MATVVTVACNVSCGHLNPAMGQTGQVATVGTPKLNVAGSPVLLVAGIAGKVVASCAIKPVTASPPSSPCLLVAGVGPGCVATKLFVTGQPVVIAPLTGTTNGVLAGVTPQTLLTATASQTLLNTV